MEEYQCCVCGDHYYDAPTTPGNPDHVPMKLLGDDPCCRPCHNMITSTAKKRDRERGSGGIMVSRPKTERERIEDGDYDEDEDGNNRIPAFAFDKPEWMRVETWQIPWVLVQEHTDEWEFHAEDEDREFTESTLMLVTPRIVRRYLDQRGFPDIKWEDVEDIASEVRTQFLERMAKEGVFGEDHELFDPNIEPIRKTHSYHWVLVKAACKKYMEQWVERRQATIPVDVLDSARAMNLRDAHDIMPGANESIYDHRVREPLWHRVSTSGIEVDLQGVGLTKSEMRTFVNAVKGENKGLKGKQNTRRHMKNALAKIEKKNPALYEKVRGLVIVEGR